MQAHEDPAGIPYRDAGALAQRYEAVIRSGEHDTDLEATFQQLPQPIRDLQYDLLLASSRPPQRTRVSPAVARVDDDRFDGPGRRIGLGRPELRRTRVAVVLLQGKPE